MTETTDADAWRTKLRAELKVAMKSRDSVATSALRCVLSAIDNAEAPDISAAPQVEQGTIAGGVAGLGAAEVERLHLSSDDIESIVRREIATRLEAADEYDRLGRSDQAEAVLSEAAVLEAFLRRG